MVDRFFMKSHSLKMRREEVLASQKVGDRTRDNPKDNTYLSYMTLPNSRVWMRVRARMTTGVKMNHMNSHLNDLSCSFCKGPMEESQEHLKEECSGCKFEKGELSMKTWRGRLIFWRRMTARINEKDKKKGKGTAAVAFGCVNGKDRVVEQLVYGSISSTLTQIHV